MSRMITLSGQDIPPVLRRHIGDISRVREVVINESLTSVAYMDAGLKVHHLGLDAAETRELRATLLMEAAD